MISRMPLWDGKALLTHTSVVSVNWRMSQKPNTASAFLPGTSGLRSPRFLMFSAMISAPAASPQQTQQTRCRSRVAAMMNTRGFLMHGEPLQTHLHLQTRWPAALQSSALSPPGSWFRNCRWRFQGRLLRHQPARRRRGQPRLEGHPRSIQTLERTSASRVSTWSARLR